MKECTSSLLHKMAPGVGLNNTDFKHHIWLCYNNVIVCAMTCDQPPVDNYTELGITSISLGEGWWPPLFPTF